MKKLLFMLMMSFSLTTVLWAQNTVTGTVTSSEDGTSIPGVNVLEKGTGNGAITDIDGNYRITVGADATLVFSFIGFETTEIAVGSRSIIDVQLAVDVQALEEVVVTAFGMERQKKALGYSVTELDGEQFTQAREISIADNLAGKVAGVNVANIGSGVGGSSRVIIRGNTSLEGNNQPLYIIDGVPMDNTQLGSAGMWGGSDFGDGISSINADDIESISVLKGGTAAALYGSRASNGVILITTKSGTARKGIGVEYNSNLTFETIHNFMDFQTQYGHGNRGAKPTTQQEALDYGASAWGAALDGSSVIQFDGESRPYKNNDDNFNNYYRTGTTFTNTIALTGGSETQSFRFSASNMDNRAITPHSGMNRKNFTFSANSKWAERLTLTTKMQYINEHVDNRSRLSDAPGNGNYTLSVLPPSINVTDLKGTTDKLGAEADGTEMQYTASIFTQNPYWAAYQFSTDDVKDRVIGSSLVRYDITDWLYVQGRAGMDFYTNRRTQLTPYGTAYSPRGQLQERERRVREINLEAIIGANRAFGEINISAFVGGNKMERSDEQVGGGGSNFNIPFFHTLSNLENQSPAYSYSAKGINSVFGSAEIAFRNYLFVNATARNDWFSTLNPESNSILYPSVGASFVFSDAFSLPDIITFGKVRVAWAEVGGDTDPYRTSFTYSLIGQGHNGAALGRIQQGDVPNSELKPLTNSEVEFGFDVRLLDNKVGIDYTWYNRKTTDDILRAGISQSSGYGAAIVNVGEINNSGHELLLTGRPVETGDFSWDVTFNYAYNDAEIKQLVGDNKSFRAHEARSRNAYSEHRIAYTDDDGDFHKGGYSMIVGFKHETINGQKVYDADGLPVRSSKLYVLGSGVHPHTTGLNNSFNYKNFNFSFLLDMKFGGDLFAGTNMTAVGSGMHKMTLEGRENGLTVSGVDEDGNSQTWNIPASDVAPDDVDVQDYWGRYNDITEYFVEDADFIKLRQVIFGYNFPQSILSATPFGTARLSFVARNLWLIHSNIDNIDPESTYQNGNGQGLEWFGVPQTRSFGFNLNVSF